MSGPSESDSDWGPGKGHAQGHDHGHGHGHGGEGDAGPAPEPWPEDGLVLCLCYGEEPIELVPALYAEGQCDPTQREANRIREGVQLTVRRLADLGPDCWMRPGGTWDRPCRDDCTSELPGPAGACLEPVCPCGGCVPLALLASRTEPNEGEPVFAIDLRGRRRLPLPTEDLTHVVGINWPHGGVVSLEELREEMDGKLRIRFDRRIAPAEGLATGINRRTFTMEFGGVTRHLEFVPSCEDQDPYLDTDGCTAVYPIAPEYLRGRETIADTDVVVTLRCDFIFDCREAPVDGNHVGGRLPSGDGRPGGDFVSWFRVVHKHHHREGK